MYIDLVAEKTSGNVASIVQLLIDQQKKMMESFESSQKQIIEISRKAFEINQQQMKEISRNVEQRLSEQGRKVQSQLGDVQRGFGDVQREQQHLRWKQDQMIVKQDQLFSQFTHEPQSRTPMSSPSTHSMQPRMFRSFISPPAPTFHSPPTRSFQMMSPPYHPRQTSCPPNFVDSEADKLNTFCESLGDLSELSSFVHVAENPESIALDTICPQTDLSGGLPSHIPQVAKPQAQSSSLSELNLPGLESYFANATPHLSSGHPSHTVVQKSCEQLSAVSGGHTCTGEEVEAVSQVSTFEPNVHPLPMRKALKDSSVVLNENKHLLHPKKLKALALVLCRESIFGDDVLFGSTVTGRRFNALCPDKLSCLKTIIRNIADPNHQQNDEQFELFVWKNITMYIGDHCKKLRSAKL